MGKILKPAKAEDHQAQAKHERHQDGVIGSPVLVFLDEVYEFQKEIAHVEEHKLGDQDAKDDGGIPDIAAAPIDTAKARKQFGSPGQGFRPPHWRFLGGLQPMLLAAP
jgi:hypothetical protein